MTTDVDLEFVDELIKRTGRQPDAVIPVLQAIQEHYQYLPEQALRRVCELTQITPAAVVGVSTFYDHFRQQPAGRHRVRVCHGTACHVKGAQLIHQAVEHHGGIAPGKDMDPDRRYTLEKVACLGCCTLAPVVQIEDTTYGHLTAEQVEDIFPDFHATKRRRPRGRPHRRASSATGRGSGQIRIGVGSCCAAKGSEQLFDALREVAGDFDVPVNVQRVGCVGMCHRTPLVEVELPHRATDRSPGARRVLYEQVQAKDAPAIVERHFTPRRLTRRVGRVVARWLDDLMVPGTNGNEAIYRRAMDVRDPAVSAFLGPQRHIATEHFGRLDPLDMDRYLQYDGFQAIRRVREDLSPTQVIDTIERSGLRGRGGAGFATGVKWRQVRASEDHPKYVICNGDEGDPGAFMDRMLLESFPYRVMEGMAIAAHAVGAGEAIFYIRHEYPLAVQRVGEAIETCRRRGLFSSSGTANGLRFSIRQGAGAFVCGEETALIASLEGRRGMPQPRPPFPAQRGLWDRPTLVNNVETFAVVPWIIRHGAEAFAALGTPTSKGTKVFALAGKVRRGGLIEVPMGITLHQIVNEIGGGIEEGKRFKAVQIGGPSGGCIPAELADTPVEYEALKSVGAIMGSGGLVVLDESDCMVDLARYFLRFTQNQSCGKCTFCRIGTRRMLEILDRICDGSGHRRDLDTLEHLAGMVQQGSLCGLGATAPSPVQTTLRYFREEYEAHLSGRCPAGKCKSLIRYVVNDSCIGCTLCAQHCPADAIPMTPYAIHAINDETCTRCDTCRLSCPHEAIEVR